MVDPPAASGRESPDSAMQFCMDFAALLDARGVSLRAAEARSGWGKSTISAARRGPALPNVELVADVLAAVGEDEQTCSQWRVRHERLRSGAASSVRAEPDPSGTAEEPAASARVAARVEHPVGHPVGHEADRSGGDTAATADTADGHLDLPEAKATRSSRWSRRRLVIVGAVIVTAVVGVATWLIASFLTTAPSKPAERTIVVQNKVAFGPSDLQEDDSPSYLAARPILRCANVPGCKLPGTDLASGDTVRAVCQLQGATLTNADVRSAGVADNPNVAASALWYGIRWPDGRRGYLSEVYVTPAYRGGLGLPAC